MLNSTESNSMETDKRILVYNTVTGKMLKNLQYSENNLLIPLEEN